jgi:hypothetical protein
MRAAPTLIYSPDLLAVIIPCTVHMEWVLFWFWLASPQWLMTLGIFFFFFGGAGALTLGLVHTRQVLQHWWAVCRGFTNDLYILYPFLSFSNFLSCRTFKMSSGYKPLVRQGLANLSCPVGCPFTLSGVLWLWHIVLWWRKGKLETDPVMGRPYSCLHWEILPHLV